MSAFNCLRVTYYDEDVFKIPTNINLENKDQVKSYHVKWNVLYIILTNDKVIEVNSEGWEHEKKIPDDMELFTADDLGIEEDGFKEANLEPEPKVTKVRRVNINLENRKKTDEDGIYLLDQDNNIYDANTKELIGMVINGNISIF